MNNYSKLALGLMAAVGFATSAQAAVKYVGTRNGVDANATSEFSISGNLYTGAPAQDGGANDDGPAGDGEVLWSASNTYVLEDVVVVTNGTLRIAPGSIVRGQPQNAAGVYDPGALVIATSAKLIAVGNVAQPIVFTTAQVGNTQFGAGAAGATPAFWDLNPTNQGLYAGPAGARSSGRWGGLVLLGNAPTNIDRTPLRPTDAIGDLDRTKIRIAGEAGSGIPLPAAGTWVQDSDDRPSIEGVPQTSTAFLNGLDRYGGHDTQHSSGNLQFVTIKFGGAEIALNNELNGLTLGGVGAGTVIDRVEIFGNTDDGIEIFGGNANLKRVAVVGVEDDLLDIDVGYQGTIQFALAIAAQDSDKLAEWDGSYEGESPNGFIAASHGSGTPGPVNNARASNDGYGIYNATFIGNLAATTATTGDTSAGGVATGNNDRNHGLQFRDQSSPTLVNSVVVNPRGYGLAVGARLPNNENDVPNRFTNGYSKLQNVTFAKNGASAATLTTWAGNTSTATSASIINNTNGTSRNNEVIAADDVVMLNLPTAAGQQFLPNDLNLNPVAYGASGGQELPVGTLEAATYRGAFNPNESTADLWTRGWSVVSRLSILVDVADEGF